MKRAASTAPGSFEAIRRRRARALDDPISGSYPGPIQTKGKPSRRPSIKEWQQLFPSPTKAIRGFAV